MRVDDISDRQVNDPKFYVSYDVDGEFDEVSVSAESTESSSSATESSLNGRDGVLLDPGFGDGQEFEVIVEASNGGNIVASRTITTAADTQNPAGNDDLSLSDSATLDSSQIQDRTRTNQNQVRYRFDYTVSPTGSFSEVQLYVLNRNGNGASSSTTRSSRSVNDADVEFGNGANTVYKIAILTVDDSGAVVDDRIVQDSADNSDP
jgi:hypothetical protein